MKGLKDKVAFITGGNSGIGKVTAIEFAKRGAKVVITARREEEGLSVVEEIKQMGGEAIFVKTDVSKEAEIENAVAKTIEIFGSLDFAFNNAGVNLPVKPIHEISEDEWDFVMDINLKGVWLCMKHELRQMLKQGNGAIVNMSSMGGLIGNPNVISSYLASKHGVIGMTKAAALEYATKNIRVNAVSPAVIETPILSTLSEEGLNAMRAAHPVGRLGKPEEVASAVLWLSSEGAGFVTGHTLVIDGGYSAQ